MGFFFPSLTMKNIKDTCFFFKSSHPYKDQAAFRLHCWTFTLFHRWGGRHLTPDWTVSRWEEALAADPTETPHWKCIFLKFKICLPCHRKAHSHTYDGWLGGLAVYPKHAFPMCFLATVPEATCLCVIGTLVDQIFIGRSSHNSALLAVQLTRGRNEHQNQSQASGQQIRSQYCSTEHGQTIYI